jgi:hypothetical protein
MSRWQSDSLGSLPKPLAGNVPLDLWGDACGEAPYHGFEARLALVYVDVQKQQEPGDHEVVPNAHMRAAELWAW